MKISLNNGLRGLAKSAYATSMHWSRLVKWVGARQGLDEAPLVVGYHRVVKDFEVSQNLSISSMLVSEATFERQLSWIGKHYRFVSSNEMTSAMETGQKARKSTNDKPAAMVTFDDGYQDVYQNALPILKRMGIPATMFVVTDLVGTRQILLHDELYLLLNDIIRNHPESKPAFLRDVASTDSLNVPELLTPLSNALDNDTDAYHATRLILGKLSQSGLRKIIALLRQHIALDGESTRAFQMMDWDMLRDWVAQGMTVGSHSKTHALLAKESPAVIEEEIEGSRLELERQLNVPIKDFAYPDGSFDTDVLKAIDCGGYKAAYTVCNHQNPDYPMLSIPRRMLWENTCSGAFGQFSSAMLSCQTNGLFDKLSPCHRPHHS